MILPDINLLLYAYDALCPQNSAASRWWSDCLNGTEPVGLPHAVALGFVRLSTQPRLFQRPLTLTEADGFVRSWIAQPSVQIIQPADGHLDRVLDLLRQVGAAGNLVTDAHLAALAIEHHAVLHTTDADFIRFTGLRWFNPITGLGSDKLARRK